MAALQRDQLNRLCSTSETFENAQSIIRLADAKTGPGSGFEIKNSIALPAICAYLASEQLNTGEVSLQSAMSAACVTKAEFSDMLNKIRAALRFDQETIVADVTYETLVDAYRIPSREQAIACMEDAESALPQVDVFRDKYGDIVVSCAVFYWVCQLMEEPSVRQQTLCQAYSIQPKTFKVILTILDTGCDGVADQIKSYLKSPTRLRATTNEAVIRDTSPSKKRANNGVPLPETPTKRRRVDYASLTKLGTSVSPAKRSSTATMAAFHAALKDRPTKLPIVQESELPCGGPSTPRRPLHAKVTEATGTPVQADSQTSPTRPAIRNRFRPVFLEQQQWCARDLKVEQIWAAAEVLRARMVELRGCPLERLVS